MKTIRPLNDRVVVNPLEREETTPGGLILPETARERPLEGKVLAVGPGRYGSDGQRIPIDVRVGAIVVFAKYAGVEVNVDGELYLVLKESDVIGVISTLPHEEQ